MQTRVHLGDPSQDIWTYRLHTFLCDDGQFRIPNTIEEEQFKLISRNRFLLELGESYRIILDESANGVAVICKKVELPASRGDTRRWLSFYGSSGCGNKWWLPCSFCIETNFDFGIKATDWRNVKYYYFRIEKIRNGVSL